MGNFQAIAAGLGEGGEQFATGANNAINEALKVQAQQHLQEMDIAHLGVAQNQQAIEKAGQAQAYTLAQQNHELMRQQIIAQGWVHAGTTYDNGQYYQIYNNPRTGETSRIPYQGTPPDSPEGTLRYYNVLKSAQDESGKPLFTHRQIVEKVLNEHDLYRTDPAGVITGFQDEGREMFEEQGISKVRVPGFGMVDLTTPQGQANYAQMMGDAYWGKGAWLKAVMGLGTGKPVDMTGWTANEQRQYKAKAAQIEQEIGSYRDLAKAGMGASFNPVADLPTISKQLMDQTKDFEKQLDDLYEQIEARHGRGNQPGKGAPWSKSAWAAANPGKDADAAAEQARAAGAIVIK